MALLDNLLNQLEFVVTSAKDKLTTDQLRETEELLKDISKLLKDKYTGTQGRAYYETGYTDIKTNGFFVNKLITNKDSDRLIITDIFFTNISIVDAIVQIGSGVADDSPFVSSPENLVVCVPQYETVAVKFDTPFIVPSGCVIGIKTQAATPLTVGDVILSTSDLTYVLIGRYQRVDT